MSYLARLRLHFAGRFFANSPTGNNDGPHLGANPSQDPASGYNRDGDGAWRLRAAVTSAFDRNGVRLAENADAVLDLNLADGGRYPAKLVDLDPQCPSISTIYGQTLCLRDANEAELLRGELAPAPMLDPWDGRIDVPVKTDLTMGAAFQSVLTHLKWNTAALSPWLRELRAASVKTGRLSIKFNVDSYNPKAGTNQFTGRAVGTIGPYLRGEPKHFTLGRHLIHRHTLYNAVAVLDRKKGKYRIDLGNSLPITLADGPFEDLGCLMLRCTPAGGQTFDVAEIPYRTSGSYERTAGIVEVPADRSLTPTELALTESNPLEVWFEGSLGPKRGLTEIGTGLYARADCQVLRLSPGDHADAKIFATRFGRAQRKANIVPHFDTLPLRVFDACPELKPGTPECALQATPVITNGAGVGWSRLSARAPGGPRMQWELDGQVYSLRYLIDSNPMRDDFPPAYYDVVNVRIWDEFDDSEPVTWEKTVLPIFAFYQRCFPVAQRHFPLTDLARLRQHKDYVIRSLHVPLAAPNHMPVTRDLSPARRKAIIAWLHNPTSFSSSGPSQPTAGPKNLQVSGPVLEAASYRVKLDGITESRHRVLEPRQ